MAKEMKTDKVIESRGIGMNIAGMLPAAQPWLPGFRAEE
jgi:hypothetical protein